VKLVLLILKFLAKKGLETLSIIMVENAIWYKDFYFSESQL